VTESLTWVDANDPLRRLPKVALHDHLDGSLRPETLIDLATASGIALPRTNPSDLQVWLRDFAELEPGRDWEDLFGLSTSVMQSAPQLRRVAREYVETLVADGVVYAEARWAPEKHLAGGLTIGETVEAVHDGLDEGMADARRVGHVVEVRQLLSVMRTGQSGAEIVAAAARSADAGVVGVDLAGHEEGHPAHEHAIAFDSAAELGLHRTIHAGEAAGAPSIADALDTCHAERIGHGVREAALAWAERGSDPAVLTLGETATRVRDRRIVLELCPTSNSNGGVVDAIAQHPIALLQAAGIRVSLHPDNRMLSVTSVTSEMRTVVTTFGWSMPQLRAATLDALDAAFGPRDLIERIRVDRILPAWG
jgi:adenosine deaminase